MLLLDPLPFLQLQLLGSFPRSCFDACNAQSVQDSDPEFMKLGKLLSDFLETDFLDCFTTDLNGNIC